MNAVEEETLTAREKCTKQNVLIADKIVKFLSDQKKENQFIVETVIKNTENTNYF
jgi:hypothetical protein